MKEQMAKWGDPWKYGIKANQTTIDAFINYNVEQGMIRKPPACADIFAAGTLDTYRKSAEKLKRFPNRFRLAA